MKKLLLAFPLILIACGSTPAPKTAKDSMVDKAWQTDAIWWDICQREKPAMCYGAVYHSEDKK
jgi:hypothetical protein